MFEESFELIKDPQDFSISLKGPHGFTTSKKINFFLININL